MSSYGRLFRVSFLAAALAVVCLSAFVPPAAAQESINYASVSGRVLDQSGAAVTGAQVTARQTETNITNTSVTDGEGRFRFPYLKVGPYEIVVSKAGFANATRKLTLTVGAAFEVPVSLTVSGVETNVTVAAETTVIEAARSQIAGTISDAEIRNLPMNGRNFLDLALLVPGVSVPNNGGATQLFQETSAVAGSGLSISSQRNFSNNTIVDGLSANDDAGGFSGIPAGVGAVDQFQVVTSGGQAELGRAIAGYVNVVIKSGTNALRGDAYGYFRDDTFNAPNALTHTTLPMNQAQYGGSLGGPITRDRTFFFANAERRSLDQSGVVTITQPNVDAINARLAAVSYQGPPVTTGVYPNPVRTNTIVGKVDHQFNGKDLFNVRYSEYGANASNSRGAGALNAPSASAGLDNIDHTVAVGNTMTLGPRTVNETRAQFAYSSLHAPPTDPIGPAVSITNVASFGTLSGSPTARLNKMYEVVDTLSHQARAHALRVGVDFLYNDDTITFPRSNRGSYAFSSLANFLAGTYNNAGFTQTFGPSVVAQTNPNLGVYAQDEWKAGASLTVNAGLRYDLQYLETIRTDTNNVSPRAGFAWVPFSSRRTVIRGSAGLFFDRVPLRALANALLSAGNTSDLTNLRQSNISLSPTQAAAPVFPNILAAPVQSVTLFNLTTMNPNMQNAHSRQASVEVERQLGAHMTVSAAYQYLHGMNLIISVNQNVPTCAASGTNNGCRPNPAYANNSQYSPLAHSDYHGLHLSFLQRPTRWGNYRVSYTYSKSMNDVGENFFSSPIDPTDISKDWGRSDDDQRHRLVVYGVVQTSTGPASTLWQKLSHDFQLSGVVQAYSALPLNITSGVTTIQGTAGRPIVNGEFIGRNTGVGPDYFTMSLRLNRTFVVGKRASIEGMVEAFNLTNHVNDLTIQGGFGPGAYPTDPLPTFGTVLAVGESRSLQFGLRARF